MQPQEATLALNLFLEGIETERQTTRRVLAAIPEDKCDYRPEKRIRSAFEMAWHLVSSDIWFLEGILHGAFGGGEPRLPPQIKTVRDVIAWYDGNLPALIDKVRAMKPEELARPVDFFGVLHQPAVKYLPLMATHSVHHRAQLALYLRMMGEKVPSIYGGSLDEPFPAQ